MHLPPFLTHKLGPLPVWGWMAGAGAGALAWWYFHRGSNAPVDNSTLYQGQPNDALGGGGGGFDTGTGTGGTGTGSTTGGSTSTTDGSPPPPIVHTPVGVINLGDNPMPVQAPGQVNPFGGYIPGTPPGTSPDWVQVPAGATPNPNDVITTPDGVRWMLKASSQQNILNGSGGYGPVAVSQNDQAFVNTMRLAGHDDIVSMGYLDPTSVGHSPGDDAVLTVPGSPGWEFEQGIAHAFEAGLAQGLPPQQAAQRAGVGYLNTGNLPDYVNTPQYQSMLFGLPPANGGLAGVATPGQYGGGLPQAAPAPQVAAPFFAPLTNGGQFTNANPNTAQPPTPPPAPPPVPGLPNSGGQEQLGPGLSYATANGVPSMPSAPIGLSFG